MIGGVAGTELQLLADGKAMDAIGSGKASAALVEFLLRAYVASPCAHTTMPSNPDTIKDIVAAYAPRQPLYGSFPRTCSVHRCRRPASTRPGDSSAGTFP